MPNAIRFALRRRGWRSTLAIIGCAAAFIGCSAAPVVTPSSEAGNRGRMRANAEVASADDLMVVDCLLPGLIRRVGGKVYVTPRRPTRTTVLDCHIRGGEYTAYDRADYSTALAVWLVEAENGDPEAQYYVGQIYEKGLGREADYAKAAEWYTKAAEKDYSPAQNSLGFLYEKGLGVGQDTETALNWYRRASGLPDELIVLEGEEYEELLAQLASGSQELSKLEQQIEELEQLLETERSIGAERQAEIQRLLDERMIERTTRRRAIANLRQQLAELNAEPGPVSRNVDFGPFRALVIGNSDYRDLDSLPWAIDQAHAIAELMENRYGYQVTTLINADRYQILSALNELREELSERHNLLIFYVGHSTVDPDTQRSWWQPVDAEPDRRTNWISTRVLSDHLDLIPAKHVLLIADAFYGGVLTRSSVPRLPQGMSAEKRAEYVQQMLSRRARLVLARGGTSGGVAGDRPAPFLSAFVELLRANDEVVLASKVYRELCERLATSPADAAQIPEFAPIRWARSEGGADFFFVPQMAGSG